MTSLESDLLGLAVACGIGLLIGLERERNKGTGPTRSPAGIRTFTATSVIGLLGSMLGGTPLLGVLVLGIVALVAIAYLRRADNDPGLTTEFALLITLLLGGLSYKNPALAASIATVVAILLAAKMPVHRFVRSILTEKEVADALILAAATFVILPLLPNRYFGPFNAINPRVVWGVAILLMGISAAGHVATRAVGTRHGLPLAGFITGFVSSIATTGAMGARVKRDPGELNPASTAAVLSSVATFVQLAVVIGVISRPTLATLAAPLICGGVVTLAYGAILALLNGTSGAAGYEESGHAFDLKSIFIFAASLSLIQFIVAALSAWFGEGGVVIAGALAGLADTHAAAASIATLVTRGTLNSPDAVIPILIALTANTGSKAIFSVLSGGKAFSIKVVSGLGLSMIATWAGAWFVLRA